MNLHTVPISVQNVAWYRVPWFLLLGSLQFIYGDLICEWKTKSSPRENISIKKKQRWKLSSSLSLWEAFPVPPAPTHTWFPSPLNFISTFSDSDAFPGPKLLTPGWTNMNVLPGITELKVWYAGCLINLSWTTILCRVVSAFPKAFSLGYLWAGNKGYIAVSVWVA